MDIQPSPPEWFTKAIAHKRKSFYIDVDNCKIHYQRWFQNESEIKKPPLLFVHGGGAHVHWWDFIAPSFLDEYEVLALDLSGMGDSEHREVYSDHQYAKELIAVCEHAGYSSNISIVSHSYGGRAVLKLALEKPEVLNSIIIADCTLLTPTEIGAMKGIKDVPKSPFGKKKVYPSKEAGLERFRLMPPQSCDNQFLVDYIADYSIGPVDGGWSWKFDMNFVNKRNDALIKTPLLEEIKNISCPVANLYAENSMLFPREIVELYKEKYPPHTQFACLADAKHHLLLDQPKAFVETLKSLLKDLKARPVNSASA